MKFKRQYSGQGIHSRRFWRHIRSLPEPAREIFSVACQLLCSMEHSILGKLEQVEGNLKMFVIKLDDVNFAEAIDGMISVTPLQSEAARFAKVDAIAHLELVKRLPRTDRVRSDRVRCVCLKNK